MNDNISIKDYFTNRYCIKYNYASRLFQFNEQSDQLVLNDKLRLVISLDSLDSLDNQYQTARFRTSSLYFLIVR